MNNNIHLQPTKHEQFMLELINRARSNPNAEAELYNLNDLNRGLNQNTITSDPKQPLVFNFLLIDAARKHSQWMSDNNNFSHTGQGDTSPGQRMAAAGYNFTYPSGWGENIAWQGTTGIPNVPQYIADEHRSLFLSDGHRKNILDDSYREIGIGAIEDTMYHYDGVITTQKFVYSGLSVFLTGVAFDDLEIEDGFYTIDEGLSNIEVKATRQSDNQIFTTHTMDAGGYQIALSPGTYDIEFFQNGTRIGNTNRRTIDSQNIKLDLDTSNVTQPDQDFTAIRVEAEDYENYHDTTVGNRGGVYRDDDVDLQATSDTGGGFNVGWIGSGEWLTYDVDVPETGLYQIVARVASNRDQQHHLELSLDGQTNSVSFGGTGGWQSWEDALVGEINLTAGNHELRLDMDSSSFNINYIDLLRLDAIRVEAEDYENYFDTSSGNIGGAYRNEDVDLQATTDIGGGFNVGWIAQGEWLTYDVDVPESGSYRIVARVASNRNQQHNLDLSIDGQTNSVSFGSTGGWQSWEDALVGEINLTEGNHELRLDMGSSGFNVNYIDLLRLDKVRVEAEDYENYFDSTSGNIGKAYRNEDVDLQATKDIGGGFNVGWIAQGEWLTYDMDVPETGSYKIVARVASKVNRQHQLDLSLDGQTSSVSFGGTGGWQTWEDAIVGEINLTAGNHELRLDMDSSSFNINYIDFIPEF